jgi:hypothetical protein
MRRIARVQYQSTPLRAALVCRGIGRPAMSSFKAFRPRSGHKHCVLTVCQYWSPLAAPRNGAAFFAQLTRGQSLGVLLVNKGAGE